MKKLIALFAICAMVTSLLAQASTDFGLANWRAGGFTLPVAYTGTIKAAGWEDEGLCYNWEKDKNSIPLFLGLCQPCLECVPCDIDMQHAAPTADATKPQVAFFNRARLYVVTDVDKKAKKATIQVVDLIDAYSNNKDHETYFQFYNTVDSIDYPAKPEKGRIAAFFDFPLLRRNSAYGFMLNQYQQSTDTPPVPLLGASAEPALLPPVDADDEEDGSGFAALMGVKDSKNWFKYGSEKYKIISIKKMDGDLLIAQDSFTDTPCRRGDDPLYTAPVDDNGEGAWWNAASISLRRTDSVTKKMMADVTADKVVPGCVPCLKAPTSPSACRKYLDYGIVKFLIDKKYKGYEVTYLVDTNLSNIYGDPESVSGAGDGERFVVGAAISADDSNNAYLNSLAFP